MFDGKNFHAESFHRKLPALGSLLLPLPWHHFLAATFWLSTTAAETTWQETCLGRQWSWSWGRPRSGENSWYICRWIWWLVQLGFWFVGCSWFVGSLVYWFFGLRVGSWLVGWLVGWFVGWFVLDHLTFIAIWIFLTCFFTCLTLIDSDHFDVYEKICSCVALRFIIWGIWHVCLAFVWPFAIIFGYFWAMFFHDYLNFISIVIQSPWRPRDLKNFDMKAIL